MAGGPWAKRKATRWLLCALCSSLIVSIVSVVCMVAGLTGLKAQGVGSCYDFQDDAPHKALGKWDDGPADMRLNWYVCKAHQVSNTSEWQTFGGSFYQANCGWVDYDDAMHRCSLANASLVSIKSQAENDFVQNLCGYETCWIGLSERPSTEEWIWADGTVAGYKSEWKTYTNWNEGEPNNWEGQDETVAFMSLFMRIGMPDPEDDADDCSRPPRAHPSGSGKWFDIGKQFRIQFSICEKNEIAELVNGSRCPQNWEGFEGSCYFKLCALHNYWEASKACEKVGANLVSISSKKENEFVRGLCGANTCRIGLSEPDDSESWSWADGTDVGEKFAWKAYVNWNDGEPNNWGGHDEDCAMMNINDIGRSLRLMRLFSMIDPAGGVWSFLQIVVPICLLVGTCFASKFNFACCAQATCIVAGLASVGLGLEIIIWVVMASKVDENWPGGSRTLLLFESLFALVQVVLCCLATAKAQELQWATTVGWNPMGVREVDGLNAGGPSLSTELREQNIAEVGE